MKAIVVSTPSLPVTASTPVEGFDVDGVARILDQEAKLGAAFCLPHQCTTDAMCDRTSRTIRKMDQVCKMIRERGMVPGLSTHMPESITYADETDLDVETYISIYNSMGFLMQVEVDWVARMIREAKKPVMTIKPMAAGHLRPFQALTFVWNTIRPQDMVTVGTMSADGSAGGDRSVFGDSGESAVEREVAGDEVEGVSEAAGIASPLKRLGRRV